MPNDLGVYTMACPSAIPLTPRPRWHFLMVILLLLASCGLREGQLIGTISIETREGQPVRLGLVEVQLIPEEAVVPFIQAKQTMARTGMASLQSLLEQARAELREAEAAASRARIRLEQRNYAVFANPPPTDGTSHMSLSRRLAEARVWSQMRDQLRGQAGEALKEWERQRSIADAKRKSVESLSARYEYWRTPEYYFQELPPALRSVTADADGAFTLPIAKGKRFALAVRATQAGTPGTERYFWLTWVSLDGEKSKRIRLGNESLFGVQHPDAVVNPA
jgi:hypothetical protein